MKNVAVNGVLFVIFFHLLKLSDCKNVPSICCVVSHVYFILQYNQYKTPMENIGLQDSLLSRFDLLFIVLDIVSYLIVI